MPSPWPTGQRVLVADPASWININQPGGEQPGNLKVLNRTAYFILYWYLQTSGAASVVATLATLRDLKKRHLVRKHANLGSDY